MAEKTATQTGGVEEETVEELKEEMDSFEEEQEEFKTEEPETDPNPNDLYREQLAERRAQQLMEGEDSAEEEDEEPGEEIKTESDNAQQPEETDAADPLVDIKVDGQTHKIKQSELVKGYQIDAAARKRLQEAVELKKELDVERATLDQRLRAVEQLAKRHDTEKKIQAEELDFSDLVLKIREGDDEDAEKALQKLYQSAVAGSRVEIPDVNTLVENKLRERDQRDREAKKRKIQEQSKSAAEIFKNTFKQDLETNPKFWDLAVMEDKALETDPDWMDKSFSERYIEAGNRARAWLTPKSPEPQSNKKRSGTKPVIGRNARAKIGEDEVIPTKSDIIRELAESRGQRHLS